MANEENESKNLENAKSRIIEIIKALNDENTKKLLKAVEEALNDEKKVTNSTNQCIPGKKQFWFIFSGIIILGMILSVFKPFIHAGKELEFEMLFGFLVFVVALASYVASVARQIIERLHTDKIKEKITPRKNLYYLVSIPSTNPVLLDDSRASNFALCEKIRNIAKRKCTWP